MQHDRPKRRDDDHPTAYARCLCRDRHNCSRHASDCGNAGRQTKRKEWNYGHHTSRIAAVRQGPADYFTGSVRVDPLFQNPEPSRVTGGLVTFEPGARSNWHTHPRGQTLIVVSGVGWTQCWGEPKQDPARRCDLVPARP